MTNPSEYIMGLFGTLNTGATGLSATSTAMGVIGDNIANINTTGFKGGRADFASMIPNTIGSLGGAQQMGSGAGLSQVRALFGQGTLNGTGSALDMAITGNGFFQVSDGEQDYYTRDGSFFLDKAGYVTTSGGLRVQGYSALSDGTIVPRGGDLHVDTGVSAPSATSAVTFDLNLPYQKADWADTLSGYSLDGSTETLEDLRAGSDFLSVTSSTIYDEAGNAHEVSFIFEQTDEFEIKYKAVVDGAEMGADEGYLYEIGSGTIELNSDQSIKTNTWTPGSNDPFVGTGSAPDFDVLLGMDSSGEEVNGGLRTGDGDLSVNSVSQDGYGVGEVSGIAVDGEGIVRATYTNGEEQILGQVVLATFDSQGGLRRLGGNLFGASAASGEPAIGIAGTGGRGGIQSFALEGSNVELEHEFVRMIQSQRAYQANARVISTASDTLQELVNLL